jgi:hypothetical protein
VVVERLKASASDRPPILILDRSGNTQLEFGDDKLLERGMTGSGYDTGRDYSLYSHNPPTDFFGSGLWLYRRNRLDVSLWTLDGKQIRRIVGEPSWFKPWVDMPRSAGTENRFPPFASGLQVGANEELWLYIIDGHEPWKPVGRGAPAHERYDTIVAVIDTRQAQLLAVRRFPGRVLPISGCFCASVQVEDSVGDLDLHIVALSLGR